MNVNALEPASQVVPQDASSERPVAARNIRQTRLYGLKGTAPVTSLSGEFALGHRNAFAIMLRAWYRTKRRGSNGG